MLWRHLFRKKGNYPVCSRKEISDIPLGYVLEARMLFDGAIAATADQASTTQHTSQDTNAEASVHTDNTDSTAVAIDSNVIQPHKEVVFIDTSVADYQTLVNQVPSGVDVVLLDSSKDGLTQMAEWAQTHHGYDAIHIISHGSEGQVSLGTLALNTNTALTRASDLATLGSALTETGDILFYGCDIGSPGGSAFIQLLSDTTGADIAASNDNTGAAALGGDWVLETSVGSIQADVLSVSDYSHVLSTVTFVVDSQEDTDANNNNMFVRTIDGASFTFKAGSTITGKSASYLDIQEDTDPNYQISGGGIGPGIYSLSDRNGGSGMDFEISVQSGYSFDLTGFETQLRTGNLTIYYVKEGVTNSFSLTPGADSFHTYSGLTTLNDVTSVVFTSDDFGLFQNIIITDVKAITPKDSTSTLTAGAASEATTFSTTATSVGSATSLMDFTITDTGDSDGAATTVSELYANVSGSATSSELSNMTFLLSGPDASNVVGTYDSSTGRITFSGLNVSISDGGHETYTIKAYLNDNASSNDITDHHTVILSINASNVTTESGSSTFTGAQTSVTNGSGASIDVVATKLIYNQAPSTSVVSGINFTNQPVIFAVDDRGNIDTDFSSSVTLSENGSGSLTGTTQVTASNGIATFSGVKYTSASDADANFVLTAASGSLASATSAAINPDVVATGLVFSTQPTPTVIQDGQSTSFTVTPVVQAVDANGMVDQDYTTNIVLSVTDPNDSVVDGTVNSLTVTSGDQDASATTVTLTQSGGIATYTGLIIQYTNSGSANTLALRATSGALTAVNSSSITSTVNTAPVFSNLNGGTTYTENGSAVVMDNNVTVADTELDGLNSGQGNYNGASITLARNGGASSNDLFGNSGLLGTLTQGQNFTYNGTTVGSVTTNSAGTLTLTFNSSATSAMVDAVLQSLTYTNSSDNPPTSVTLNWTFNDGSLNSTGTNQAVLAITPVNDAPTISTPSVSKTFNEDSALSFSAADFGFSDVDSSDTLQSITIVTAPTAGELFIDANSDGVRDSGDTLLGDGAVVSAADISKLTFRPAANANGAGYATFTWTVSDGTASSTDIGSMTLNVTAVNDAPVISDTNISKTFNEDSVQTFSASDFGFSDVDSGDTLHSITILTAPPTDELFIDDNSDGVRGLGDTIVGVGSLVSADEVEKLVFRPAANANGAGYATFTWKVSDGTLSSSNTGTMTLNVTSVNDAPTLSSGMTVNLASTTEDVTSSATTVSSLLNGAGYGDVDSGASGGIAITTAAGNGDWQYSTDNGATWFSIGTVSGSSALLLGSTAQLRYVPDSANGETTTLSFKAWDQTSGSATVGGSKGLADTSTSGDSSAFSTNNAQVSLVVTSVNDAPTIDSTVSSQSATKDAVFSFTVPVGTFVDVDNGDVLTLSATQSDGSALPSWLSFNPTTRTFSGTPANADIGNLTIRITATDSSNASVSTTFGLTVNDNNHAPVVATPLADQTIAQDGSLSFSVPTGTFTDSDVGDTLTLSATLADGSALPSWLSFNPATGTFSGTPANGDVGSLSIRVTATDGSNAAASATFALTVSNINDAPVVSGSVAPQSVAQDSPLNFTLPGGLFTDSDVGDTLTLSATLADGSALPSWLSFNPATGTFSGTPGNGDVGSLSIRVTASDGSDAAVSATFALTVSNINDAPVVSGSVAPQSVAQDSPLNFTLPGGLFTDPDVGDTLTLSATLADGSALPSWLSFNPATGTFSGTPANGDVGSLSIRVTATDGSNAAASATFSMSVTPAAVNGGDPEFRLGSNDQTPIMSPTNSVTITLGQSQNTPITLGSIFSQASLPGFDANRTTNTSTVTSTLFQSPVNQPQAGAMPMGQIANTFAPGSLDVGTTSRFDSSLGAFPSFNNGGALGGNSTLSGVFSGMNLPSITPMEVFSRGSWQGVNVDNNSRTPLTSLPDATAMEFAPNLEQQLQSIGNLKLQRLAVIEQALLDMDKHSIEAERS
ncbi:hypothetical protein F164LOC_02305 [Pectobacterium carotovorum]|nr:hypothetical protein F164LOC_02305 [Pectobacterium carotovorum]